MTKQKNWKSFWNVEYEESPYVWDTEDHSNPINKVQVRFDGSRGHMSHGINFFHDEGNEHHPLGYTFMYTRE
jgi:peptide methionine sulfoxide reductase MsrB